MKASTVAALERINRDFYHRRAFEFSDTRKQAWPGWQRLLDLARGQLDSGRISVLDLGCGNGRFADELERRFDGESPRVAYLGVDASVPLLVVASGAAKTTPESASAKGAGAASRRFLASDLVGRPLAELGAGTGFDLIVNFGLMHHVPSRERRRLLLEAGARHLRPGGLLAVSFWQFGDRERFAARLRSWRDHEALGVDSDDLEDGDVLLAWGDAGAVRYCHFIGPAEAAELVDGLGLSVLESFSSDGGSNDLNLYFVLSKARS